MSNKNCIICSKPLTGQQKVYCGYDCRKEGYRRHYHKTKVLKGYRKQRKDIDLDILFDNSLTVLDKMEKLNMGFYALKACFYRKRKQLGRTDAVLTYAGCKIEEVERMNELRKQRKRSEEEINEELDRKCRELLKCMK